MAKKPHVLAAPKPASPTGSRCRVHLTLPSGWQLEVTQGTEFRLVLSEAVDGPATAAAGPRYREDPPPSSSSSSSSSSGSNSSTRSN